MLKARETLADVGSDINWQLEGMQSNHKDYPYQNWRAKFVKYVFVRPQAGWRDGRELDICTMCHLLPTIDDASHQPTRTLYAFAVGDQLMHERPESTFPSSPKHTKPPGNLKITTSASQAIMKTLRNVPTSRPSDMTEGQVQIVKMCQRKMQRNVRNLAVE